ncbi:MAG TPA: glycosyltransferase, partial [Segetibacter sp.]
MIENPFVSVVMTTYNHQSFIAQAIESVIMQKTNFQFELVIGEDCSTDHTTIICREYALKYPNIIKLLSRGRNLGMKENGKQTINEARGKYIAILEGDDYWVDENKLQMQVDLLEKDQTATLCFTQVSVFDEKQQSFQDHWSRYYNSKERYTLKDILKKFNIVTCTVVFKNVFGKLPYNPLDFPTGDVVLFSFILLKG